MIAHEFMALSNQLNLVENLYHLISKMEAAQKPYFTFSGNYSKKSGTFDFVVQSLVKEHIIFFSEAALQTEKISGLRKAPDEIGT